MNITFEPEDDVKEIINSILDRDLKISVTFGSLRKSDSEVSEIVDQYLERGRRLAIERVCDLKL